MASGQVEVEQNRQIVQHPDGGVVAEILVKDGDYVDAGASLVRLDGALLDFELAIVEGQFFEILARRGRLEAERDDARQIVFPDELVRSAVGSPVITALMTGQERLFAARAETEANEIDQLQRRRGQIASQIEGIAAQRMAADSQLALIGKELADLTGTPRKGADPGRAGAGARTRAGAAGRCRRRA